MQKSFVNRLHLVLHACVETFDVIFFLRLRVYEVESVSDDDHGHATRRGRPAGRQPTMQRSIAGRAVVVIPTVSRASACGRHALRAPPQPYKPTPSIPK